MTHSTKKQKKEELRIVTAILTKITTLFAFRNLRSRLCCVSPVTPPHLSKLHLPANCVECGSRGSNQVAYRSNTFVLCSPPGPLPKTKRVADSDITLPFKTETFREYTESMW